MIILALDTALNVASAGLWDSESGRDIARESVSLSRGHEAALMTLVRDAVACAPRGFMGIDRIGVTVGPGSFTGLRIGVAAARAFGLVTGAPVVGVSTLAAFAAAEMGLGNPGTIVAAVDARKSRVYAQAFAADGRALAPARLGPARDILASLEPGPLKLVGSGAPILAIEAWRTGRSADVCGDLTAPDIGLVARLAARADPALAQPRPLYFEAASVTVLGPPNREGAGAAAGPI